MTVPKDLTRRELFVKAGILLNGIVGADSGGARSCVISYLPSRAAEARATTRGLLSGIFTNFLPARRASPRTGIPS